MSIKCKIANMEKETVGARIKRIRKQLKLTQKQVAQAVGVSAGAVTQWELDMTQPRGLNLTALAEFLRTSPSEIIGGENQDAKISDSGISLTGLDLWDDQTPLSNDEVALPFFREVQLSAGHGSSMVQENGGAKLRFAKSTLKKCGVNEVSAACVTVSGNSMEPVLPDGATVGIDTEKTAIKDGKMFAIDHGGMLRVKILYRLPNGGIRLRSFNRDEWPDEDISGKEIDQVRIIGQVFWSSVLY
ncbi:helix-turn-helix domain-containing protein [Shewanella algae]|nr:helix-turn-helix domain-containing protein [Shewanella algae]